MKLLTTGASGQLGHELETLIHTGVSASGSIPEVFHHAELYKTDLPELDLSDLNSTRDYISSIHPDIIINCAAYTNVDGCERNQETAYLANTVGPKNLAICAEKIGAVLIHVSTDYVFDGKDNNGIPRTEQDLPAPLSVYGTTKLAGENFVKQFCSRHFIVRTAWLYSPYGKNFVKTICNAGRKYGRLEVVNDQLGNPTNASDLAYMILQLADTDAYGLYHCTGSGICSWFDFASKIIEYAGIEAAVTPCTTEEYKAKHPESADRPRWSALDCSKLEQVTGCRMRDWQSALKDYFEKADTYETV